jgi:two-component system heavy metal sensor histidine kinase CusS
MSIRRKLILGLLLGLIALLLVSGTILYSYMNTVLSGQFDVALTAEARVICGLVKLQHNGEIEIDNPQGAISQLGGGASLRYFQVWREDGTVLLRSPALGKNDLPGFNSGGATAADAPAFADFELPQGRPGRVVLMHFMPVPEDEDVPSDAASHKSSAQLADKRVIVAVAQDRSELKGIMTVLFSALLGIAAFMAIGIVAVVSAGVRRGLSPLERVAAEAAKIDPNALDFRFSLAGLPAELQPICLRLNDSLERLQKAFARERRFTADVAHELRTPIAELRSLADVALKWEGDRETSLGYFKDAQDVARQMERIVTTLLSLARCQSGTMTVVREGVNLGDLIREAWDGHRQAAAERHLAVTFDLSGQSVVETDRTMLHSIVSNLLANAAQYARIGGTVACRAIANGSGLKFVVMNDVDCLSPDDLPHMLEAFWRKDAARTDGSHCGLGLTLVEAYAAALGGKIEFSLPQHDSLCAALDLP